MPDSHSQQSGTEDATVAPQTSADTLMREEAIALPFQFGRYRLEQLLGKGGMGAVYRAVDTQLDRTVALKIPFLSGSSSPSIRSRFLREAQSAALLTHPNVCPVHDLGEIDGVPYLTMAFVDGVPLAKRVGPGLPIPEALALVRKIALALQEAHDKGVIHRDLKPGNIMLDRRGEPIVMDFGLARRADSFLQLTQQGDMMGTPAYMPPEQLNGDVAAMGPGCDIWALGVMLYELLTGRLPFVGDVLALVGQISSDDPLPPSRHRAGLDPRLDGICLRAMAKDRGARWATMREFADAVAACETPSKRVGVPKGSSLSLRVTGTSIAYRPAPGQMVVTLGRQKRKAGEPTDVGNDVVLRVPGNDTLSGRISRRHLEVHRDGGQFFVVDRSKAGTLHNGRPLVPNQMTALSSGDRLVVAGVLTLEVDLDAVGGKKIDNAVTLDVKDETRAQVVLEASLGDMVTME